MQARGSGSIHYLLPPWSLLACGYAVGVAGVLAWKMSRAAPPPRGGRVARGPVPPPPNLKPADPACDRVDGILPSAKLAGDSRRGRRRNTHKKFLDEDEEADAAADCESQSMGPQTPPQVRQTFNLLRRRSTYPR